MTNKDHSDTVNVIPPEVLLEGYAQGIFPMAQHRRDPEINWYTAKKRGIIPVGKFHASRRLRRIIRNRPYRWSVNEDFRGVIEGCADRESTWISDRIIASFELLHEAGHAHSVEIFQDDQLAGGVYGVSLRAAFFAESMFQRVPEMGKVALYHCHQRLVERGFRLWDTQFYTSHLARFGCIEIDDHEYDHLLSEALKHSARFDDE